MTNAYRDENSVPTLIASSNVDGFTPVRLYADPVTHRLLVDLASSGVTSITIATANGFAGSSSGGTTPELTISTTVTGIVKGNGTALSAAVANTDYQSPIILTTTGTSGASTFNGTTLNIPQYQAAGTYVTSVSGTSNRITSSGGTTPVIDIAATYVGQTSLTTLGTITTGTWNGTVVAGQYGGTGVANTGKTITVSGNTTIGSSTDTVSFATSGNTSVTLPASGTLATLAGTETLTNKRITARITTITSNATPTVNTDNCDAVTITALATNITSMTTNLSGTPTNFQKLIYRIKDDGTPRTISWGASFSAYGVDLPTTTSASKVLTVGFIWDSVASVWGCVASAQQA